MVPNLEHISSTSFFSSSKKAGFLPYIVNIFVRRMYCVEMVAMGGRDRLLPPVEL